MEKIYEIYKALLGEFNNDSLNQNLTFVVTIAAGLLTISALVTVFISLNKQHLIQKCKELTWGMEDILAGNGKGYNKHELKSKFNLYEKLIGEPLFLNFNPMFFNFNNWAILLTILFLIATIRIWINIGVYLGDDMKEITVIGTVLLALYACLMLTLLSVRITGNLDKPKNILNGNKRSKIKTKDLCAISSSLILKKEDNILIGTIHLCLPIKNVEISPLIYGITYDDNSKWKSIKIMDVLCEPDYPRDDRISRFEYINHYQKKVISLNESNVSDNYITGSIRIGDLLRPSSRNEMGMFSNPLYPIGYHYHLNFIDYNDNRKMNHTKMEIDISKYDELQVYCYFRTNEGTTYAEYGTIKTDSFDENDEKILDLFPISVAHNNLEFKKMKWDRKVEFKI